MDWINLYLVSKKKEASEVFFYNEQKVEVFKKGTVEIKKNGSR